MQQCLEEKVHSFPKERKGEKGGGHFFQFCLFLGGNCFEVGRTPNRRKKTEPKKRQNVFAKRRDHTFPIGKSMGNMTFGIIVFYASLSSKAPRE